MSPNLEQRSGLSLGISSLADVEDFLQQPEFAGIEQNGIVQGADTAACLLIEGKVVAAAAQERFNKRKKTSKFPYDAIDFCLETAGVSITEIDSIGFGYNFDDKLRVRSKEVGAYFGTCLSLNACTAKLNQRYGGKIPAPRAYDHHLCHMYAAYSTAAQADALGLIFDAAAETTAVTLFDCRNGRIQALDAWPVKESLGLFYSLITLVLGYRFNEDEYKVMGAAPLGDRSRFKAFFENEIGLRPGGRIAIPSLTLNKTFTEKLFLTKSLAHLREALPDGIDARPFQQIQFDLCAALQARFSEALIHICQHFQAVTGHRHLVLGGGCAENCHAISTLRATGMFDTIHVSFASGDDGIALGAAALGAQAVGQDWHQGQPMPFWGPDIDEAVLLQQCEKLGLIYRPFVGDDEMATDIASRLKVGDIIAICRGRAEYGARALGNRSILADPRRSDTQLRVNLAIKKRETFRPFAPAVTAEMAHLYYDLGEGELCPYMTVLTGVRNEKKKVLPATTHVDGTARVQTVSASNNPFFHKVLSAFEAETGTPVLLNTSYNVNGQPIASTSDEVVTSFVNMDLDYLYTNAGRVEKRINARG